MSDETDVTVEIDADTGKLTAWSRTRKMCPSDMVAVHGLFRRGATHVRQMWEEEKAAHETTLMAFTRAEEDRDKLAQRVRELETELLQAQNGHAYQSGRARSLKDSHQAISAAWHELRRLHGSMVQRLRALIGDAPVEQDAIREILDGAQRYQALGVDDLFRKQAFELVQAEWVALKVAMLSINYERPEPFFAVSVATHHAGAIGTTLQEVTDISAARAKGET